MESILFLALRNGYRIVWFLRPYSLARVLYDSISPMNLSHMWNISESAFAQHAWNFIDVYHHHQQSGVAWASFTHIRPRANNQLINIIYIMNTHCALQKRKSIRCALLKSKVLKYAFLVFGHRSCVTTIESAENTMRCVTWVLKSLLFKWFNLFVSYLSSVRTHIFSPLLLCIVHCDTISLLLISNLRKFKLKKATCKIEENMTTWSIKFI